MNNINSVKNYKYSILVKKIGALKSLKKNTFTFINILAFIHTNEKLWHFFVMLVYYGTCLLHVMIVKMNLLKK